MNVEPENPLLDRFDGTNPYAPNPYASPIGIEGESIVSARSYLNPWLSIWLQPRRTIRQIVDTNPTYHVLLLAALSGIFQALDRATLRNLGDSLPFASVLILAVVVGSISGIVMLYIGGWVVRWTGSLLGGKATSEQVRAAIAWGSFPALVSNVVWVPQLAMLGREMFTSDTPRLDASSFLLAMLVGTSLLGTAVSIWGVVTLVKCVAEVHRFSAWRGLIALLLPGIVIVGVLAAVLIPAMLLMST